jgi:dipeptidyl aminopeptidase/acylaminoacyl peptidase
VLKGDILDITGTSADGSWLHIVTPGGKPGWISGQSAYTRILGLLEDIPVVDAVANSQSPAAAATPPPADKGQPDWTAAAAGGQLIFTTASGGDLYVIDVDGTGLRKLASGVIDPAVSPDGRQVAFTRWDGAESGTLYVMNLDGSGERAVLSEILQARSPTWSPDGQEIMVSFQHGGVRDPQPECRKFDADDKVHLPKNVTIISFHFNPKSRITTVCFIRTEDLQWSLRRVTLQTGKFEDMPVDLYS